MNNAQNITGTISIQTEAGGTVRRIRFNRTQVAPVVTSAKGQESFNYEGAVDRAKLEMSRWEASDQFIGQKLLMVEGH